MTISAYIEPVPPAWFNAVTAYFEVTDPDDLSHYEGKSSPGTPGDQGDEHPNDNRDPNKQMTWNSGSPAGYSGYQSACLSRQSDSATMETIDGTDRYLAETTLDITDQYSGDNYQVRATLRNPQGDPFDTLSGMTAGADVVNSAIKASEMLIAWKRVYLEKDNMYKQGCTVTAAKDADTDNNDDTLSVDSSADFSDDDDVVIFWQGGTHNTQIVSTGTGSVTVQDLPMDVPQYAGIRPQTEPDTYELSLDYITNTFGDSPDGSDAGVFVEFEEVGGNDSVPKYTEFANNATMQGYCIYWFDHSTSSTNCIQLVAAKAHTNGSMGQSNDGLNRSIVYKDAHTGPDKTAKEKDTVVHELGHQFDLSAGHVDTYNAHPNHENSDDCLMTYASDDTDGISEFCVECIDHIRELVDSL